MKSMAEDLERLRQLALPELSERYEELFGKPPRVKKRAWLSKRVAWKLEEKRLGGLSQAAKRSLEALMSEIDLPLRPCRHRGALSGHRRAAEYKLGTVFARTWHGRQVRAVAVEGGFEYDGKIYRSLSAVAKAVTAQHWSGPLFFNLRERKRAR